MNDNRNEKLKLQERFVEEAEMQTTKEVKYRSRLNRDVVQGIVTVSFGITACIVVAAINLYAPETVTEGGTGESISTIFTLPALALFIIMTWVGFLRIARGKAQ